MQLPEVRIRFSELIYVHIAVPLHRSDKAPHPLLSEKQTIEKVEQYKEEWQKYSQQILTGMCNVFDLNFYSPVVDAYVCPWVPTISAPILIAARYNPDEFVDTLTHELLHVLLTDNQSYSDIEKLGRVWRSLYPGMQQITRNHILVHAGMKHIYLDVLKAPSRLERDVEQCQRFAGYKAAWDYVNDKDYMQIITEFRGQYSELSRV